MATIMVRPAETTVRAVGSRAEVVSPSPIPKSSLTITGILVNLATAGNPCGPVDWELRDGPAGKVLLSGVLAVAINSHAGVNLTGLSILTSLGQPAYLGFLSQGPTNSRQSVAITFYPTNV